MRDAGRERADRFEFLGLVKGVLQLVDFRLVADLINEADDFLAVMPRRDFNEPMFAGIIGVKFDRFGGAQDIFESAPEFRSLDLIRNEVEKSDTFLRGRDQALANRVPRGGRARCCSVE